MSVAKSQLLCSNFSLSGSLTPTAHALTVTRVTSGCLSHLTPDSRDHVLARVGASKMVYRPTRLRCHDRRIEKSTILSLSSRFCR